MLLNENYINESLEDLVTFLKAKGFNYELKGTELIRLLIYDENGEIKDKCLVCFGMNGTIFKTTKSIWLNKKQKKFLEKYKKYKVIFPVSVKWYISEPKSFEGSKEEGYQCSVDFNELKTINKSKEKQKFVHLHNHFEFSQLDGTLNSKQWLEECQIKGFESIALTDHGTLAGILDFYLEAKKQGIKSILGYEAYIVEEEFLDERKYDHLTLIAKNDAGWNTLLKLNTFAQTKGFYYKPRITYELLKDRNKGLIVLTGCPIGKMNRLLAVGEIKQAEDLYNYYCDCFGEENVYLEMQFHNFQNNISLDYQDACHLNMIELKKILIKKKRNPKIVITNDCHYPKEEDLKIWNVINKISKEDDEKNINCQDLFLKTRKELLADFKKSVIYRKKKVSIKDFSDWCNNTVKISNRCNVEIPIGNHNLPEFPYDAKKYKSAEQLFDEIVKEGFDKKVVRSWNPGYKHSSKHVLKDYQDRLKKEVDVIKKANFINYFLIIWDIVKSAKENGIFVGAARGSVAGSLTAFVMDITNIDPLKFDLLFERFLNETRITTSRDVKITLSDGSERILPETDSIFINNKPNTASNLKVGDIISI